MPKNLKYKKQQKGKNFNIVSNFFNLSSYKKDILSLKAISSGRISLKQISSMKQSINKVIKKSGKLIVNIFAQSPITKKPIEVRMGKGKGNVDHWACKLKAGSILCELDISNKIIGLKALKFAQFRLPIKTKIMYKNYGI